MLKLFADGRVFGFLFFVLVENPFQRGAVAEPVIPCFGRDAGKSRFAIDDDPGRLLCQLSVCTWAGAGTTAGVLAPREALRNITVSELLFLRDSGRRSDPNVEDCGWILGTATNCRTVVNLGLRTRAHKD